MVSGSSARADVPALLVASLVVLAAFPTGAAAQKGRLAPAEIGAASFVLPAPPDVPAAPAAAPETVLGWTTLLDEGFEVLSFPYAPWNAFAVSGSASAFWDDRQGVAATGTWSLYCAGAGTAAAPERGPYPNNMRSWVTYGPFDLRGASAAELTFRYWNESESTYDFFTWASSVNGTNYDGLRVSGTSGGWQTTTLNLSNRLGQSQVWIAFLFESDASQTYEGAYVDDVLLRKNVGGSGGTISVSPASVAATVSSGATGSATVRIANAGAGTLAWSTEATVGGRDTPAAPGAPEDAALALARLRAEAVRAGRVRVIAELRLSEAFRAERDPAAALSQRQRIAAAADAVLARLGAADAVRFETVPYVALAVDADALDALAADAGVVRVVEDALSAPADATSQALVGAPQAWARGFTGVGQTVAILDTGVQTGHSFFAGRTRTEACFSSNFSSTAATNCPNGTTLQTGAGAAAPCTYSEACTHGTHVAGIALGRGPSYNGIAPDADLLALQVFSRFPNSADCGDAPAPCTKSYTSDQIRALEYVYAQRTTRTIASANMSLGGGSFTAACDTSPLKAIIDNLREAGIATVIASGNDGYASSMASPGCISSAVSVGSVSDGTTADRVSSFSNAAPFLSLLAPGETILAPLPGGGYGGKSGTSMAAPHVAGTWAVLRQQRPTASVSALLARLRSTGRPVLDGRNGLTFPRIQVDAALEATAAPWASVAPAAGTTAPGAQSTLTLTFDTAGLAVGTHTGRVRITSDDAARATMDVPITLTVAPATAERDAASALALALGEPRPNPTTATALVPFTVPAGGPVSVTVVDVLGRTVATLADGWRAAGDYSAAWDARAAAPGVYTVRLAAPTGTLVRRLTVVR